MKGQITSDFKQFISAETDAEANHLSVKRVNELYEILSTTGLAELCGLNPVQKKVLEMKWKENLSLTEIGEQLSLSRERVRQIYARVMVKVKFGVIYAIESYKYFDKLKQDNRDLLASVLELQKQVNRLSELKGIKLLETDKMKINLLNMNLSVRLKTGLIAANIHTLGDLMAWKKSGLLKFKNLGQRSLNELERALAGIDVKWEPQMGIDKVEMDRGAEIPDSVRFNGLPYKEKMEISLFDLDISIKLKQYFIRARISTVGDLIKRRIDVRKIGNPGVKSFEQLEKALADVGVIWQQD